ncbi:VCBS repeat domain-containing M23 family metallopeptidase [Kribbella sp. NPDC051770]|uniref:VCBS repeat domain-containing M23 family metallopeptidase n=1 Tax=Kribbella sp. NPDC051770 TaxID=3155413 RepID=UPI0034368E7D
MSLFKRSLAGLALTLLTVAGTAVSLPASAQVDAKPDFELPFPCGEKWNGATYTGHGGDNYYPLDFNWGSGDDDLGKPVVASAAGVVSLGAAGVITINHGGGWTSEYRHLSSRDVASGTQVARGQFIGRVGAVGNASGPHLHYAQLYNGNEQHIELHGQLVTYSFDYNGPLFTSYNCGVTNRPAESVNGDRYDDLLAVSPGNVLRLYPGRSDGEFGGSSDIGPGWSSAYNRIGVGDSNADGYADIYATSTDGKLHYWLNNGAGSYSKLAAEGVGWNSLEGFAVLDVNKDDKADIVARDGGILYWYPGAGPGSFGQRIRIGEGWSSITTLAGGDADGDGDGDLWGSNAAGTLYFWEGNGNGTFAAYTEVGSGWDNFGKFNVMDVNGDSKADLVAVRESDGHLFRWLGKGTGSLNTGEDVGQGWTGYRLASY